MGYKSREAVPSGKPARVNENSAQVGMSRQVFIDPGGQCLEVFCRQRRKGLDNQNAFGLQNLVLDHVWFTVMKAKTASTGISGLVPNSPTLCAPRVSRGSCFLARTRREWEGEGSGDVLSDTRNNFTPAGASRQ